MSGTGSAAPAVAEHCRHHDDTGRPDAGLGAQGQSGDRRDRHAATGGRDGSEPDETRGSGDRKRPTASVQFDTGDPGPAGHVPILRPHLGQVESLEGLRRLQAKRGGLRVNVHRGNKKPTDPSPAGYFHAMSSQSATVYGTDGRLNLWDPIVDIPSSPGDDHSRSSRT